MMLKMESPTVETPKIKTKRVQFSPRASLIKFPADVDAPAVNSMWYVKGETQKLAKAELDAIVLQDKKNRSETSSPEKMDIPGDIISKAMAMQDEESGLCRRGLEMYMPGQLARRQQRRKLYNVALLRKQELLRTLCGNDTVEEKQEVAEGLEKFLVVRSKTCRDEARALGVQDAIEAQLVHHTATSTKAPLAKSTSAPFALAKQAMSTMRRPQSAMLRAA